jgi:hypothetical protein
MQSSVLSKEKREEKGRGVDAIAEGIRAITQNTKMEIQTFKLTSEKLENGVTIEFELRANINFNTTTNNRPSQ